MWCGTVLTDDWHRRYPVADHGLRSSAHPPDDLPGRRPLRGGIGGLPTRMARTADAARPAAPDPARGGNVPVIEELLPPTVAAVEAYGEEGVDAPLFPEEEALLTHAVPKRRREFTAARSCARRAMEKLGVPAAPVVSGERGAPVWPARPGRQRNDPLRGLLRRRTGPHRRPRRPSASTPSRTPRFPTVCSPPSPCRRRRPASTASSRNARTSTGTACCSAPRSPSTRRGTRSPASGWTSQRRTSPSHTDGTFHAALPGPRPRRLGPPTGPLHRHLDHHTHRPGNSSGHPARLTATPSGARGTARATPTGPQAAAVDHHVHRVGNGGGHPARLTATPPGARGTARPAPTGASPPPPGATRTTACRARAATLRPGMPLPHHPEELLLVPRQPRPLQRGLRLGEYGRRNTGGTAGGSAGPHPWSSPTKAARTVCSSLR
ncbi:hypothetical protein STENM223S_09777 [Streptomyces tendae]